MLKEALGSLLRRRYNIYSLSPGMLRSVYCPPHSSVLMLNFQNFYITKGPTTSAEKYPASTKSVRQPRPRRGETLPFPARTQRAPGGHLDFLRHFSPFFYILGGF